MMDSSNSSKIALIVGMFILLGMICLTMLAFQVSGLKPFYQSAHSFIVKANFDNIGTLKLQSRVTIAGVTVGRVVGINLDTSDHTGYQAVVSMKLLPEVGKLLPEDSSATIKMSGLIGNNYVSIFPGGSNQHLAAGGEIEETHSAFMLEDLIGQMVFSLQKK